MLSGLRHRVRATASIARTIGLSGNDMNTDKSYSYFKLVNACQESGCPICHLVTKCSQEYLDQLFYESVTDVPIRLNLMKSFGFCNWHTWLVPTFAGYLRTRHGLRDLCLRPLKEIYILDR
jgi:hypothetical protein